VSNQFQKFIVFAAVGAVAVETLHGHQQHIEQQTPIQPENVRAGPTVVTTATMPQTFQLWNGMRGTGT
jgi:hypothetical protein